MFLITADVYDIYLKTYVLVLPLTTENNLRYRNVEGKANAYH